VKKLLIMGILSLSLCAAALPTQPSRDMIVIIAAGQSNAVGAGKLPARQITSPHAFVWRNGIWLQAKEPSYSRGKYGPTTRFAVKLSRLSGKDVGVIPCAVSGTSILKWQRGQKVYENCRKKISAARAQGYKISGIIFIQGEYDTRFADNHDWVHNFLIFAKTIRQDAKNLYAPLIFAQLGYDPEDGIHLWWIQLRESQPQAIVGRTPPVMVQTMDLEKFDGIHYAQRSQDILAARLANAMWSKLSQEAGERLADQ